MEIIDTYSSVRTAYDSSGFSFERWKRYIDTALPGLCSKLVSDAKNAIGTGEFSEDDYLSVLNLPASESDLLEAAHGSFLKATENLDDKIKKCFGRSPDVTVAFYLGLCNGAGWATEYRGKTAILLGIEKILELNWCGVDDMRALIYHELGHAYQKQYGILNRDFEKAEDSFLWQLFTEGIAMCFEQTIVGDPGYWRQDKNGWKEWCENRFEQIKKDFSSDLKTMTPSTQRYFGDWVSYNGRGDVGYYLGGRFVRFILSSCDFDEIIGFDIEKVREMFGKFLREG